MKRLSALLLAGLLGGLYPFANAMAEVNKIAIVDLQRIMQTTPQMKSIQEKLEKDFRPRRDKLVKMEASLKDDMQKFKRDAAVLSQEKKRDLEKKIVTEQQNFEREGQQYQQELSAAHNEAMEGLYTRIRQAIEVVANANKFDLVLQKDAAPYSNPTLDVTDKVLKEIH